MGEQPIQVKPAEPVVAEVEVKAEAPKEVVLTLNEVKPELKEDPMMPTLQEEPSVEPLSKTTVEKTEEAPVFFEISSAADQIPTTVLDFEEFPVAPAKPKQITEAVNNEINVDLNKTEEASKSSSLSSGGYLAKPVQIYAEEMPAKPESNTKEEPLPLQNSAQEDEPVIEMQLVVKDSQKAAEEPVVQQTQPIMMSNVEEPALQDETEELRRRAAERIAKLRNLSFNINASDPNNEFETVPAYLRRNMDINNNRIADVESFYSNYTVKSDDNNQAEISTINTFLDGKKPD